MDRPTATEIVAFMKRHGLSQSATARRSGIARQTLIRYLRQGTEDAYPYTVERLVLFMKRIDKRARKGGRK